MLLQSAPLPIHVTLQQPPGLPFWETAVISALVGTFFGFASSFAMEFVKPWIASRLLKKKILEQLDKEFCENYRVLLDVVEITKDYDGGSTEIRECITHLVRDIGGSITQDRFNYYKDNEKAAFYDADDGYRLAKFNFLATRAFQKFPEQQEIILVAMQFGAEHAKLRGIPEVKPIGLFLQYFNGVKAGMK